MQRRSIRQNLQSQGVRGHSRTPLKQASNNLLQNRKEENYSDKGQRWQDVAFEDNRRSAQEGKRDNARARCFQMRVNNIAIISDKINGLLSLIKKDKIDEVLPKTTNGNFSFYEKHNRSAHNLVQQQINKKEKSKTLYAANTQKMPYMKSINSYYPPPYSQQAQNQYKNEDDCKKRPKYQEPELSRKSIQQLNQQKMEKKQKTPKRCYLPPEEYSKNENSSMQKEKQKTIKHQYYDQPIQFQRYQIKIQRRDDEKNQKTNKNYIEKIEEKKNNDNRESKYGEINIQKKFQKVTISHQQRVQNKVKQKHSFDFQRSIPKPQASKFMPILIQQSARSQKLNSTTKLIDEQIKRIKSKIEQSQNHSQWIHSKLQNQQHEMTYQEQL